MILLHRKIDHRCVPVGKLFTLAATRLLQLNEQICKDYEDEETCLDAVRDCNDWMLDDCCFTCDALLAPVYSDLKDPVECTYGESVCTQVCMTDV